VKQRKTRPLSTEIYQTSIKKILAYTLPNYLIIKRLLLFQQNENQDGFCLLSVVISDYPLYHRFAQTLGLGR